MAKVTAPVSGYNGTTAGVVFKDGAGQTDDPRIKAWLTEHGYLVEGTEAPAEGPAVPDKKKGGK